MSKPEDAESTALRKVLLWVALPLGILLVAWIGYVFGSVRAPKPTQIAQLQSAAAPQAVATSQPSPAAPASARSERPSLLASYQVTRVIDGDTLVLNMDGNDTTVRLIGVDTPETVHPQKPVEAYGKEASQFLTGLLLGQAVRVEYEPGSSKLDKYGRTLAYVYRVPDDLFVNLEIVKQGYGHAYTQYPFAKMEQFRGAEAEARGAGLGLWGLGTAAVAVTTTGSIPLPEADAAAAGASPEVAAAAAPGTAFTTNVDTEDEIVHITRTGAKYHRAGCRYLAKSDAPIPLKDALSRGLTPCSVCAAVALSKVRSGAPPPSGTAAVGTPPVHERNQAEIVHITRTGQKYHRAGCRYLSQSDIPVSLGDAIARMYTPCSVCQPPQLTGHTSQQPVRAPPAEPAPGKHQSASLPLPFDATTRQACARCNGAGMTACSYCGGRDLTQEVCEYCRGRDLTQEVCEYCQGRDLTQEVCEYCKGVDLTREACNYCGGSGQAGHARCVMCSGTGMKRRCVMCSGTGRKRRCVMCSGTGMKRRCVMCSGTGASVCPACLGGGMYAGGPSTPSAVGLPALNVRRAENDSYYGEISPTTGRPKDVYVRGYYRKDGTYVRSHYRSRPRR